MGHKAGYDESGQSVFQEDQNTICHGCISENAESIDKIVALHESKSSTKTLPKAKATDGNLPYRHFFA
jgi:hypothetical protein